MTRRVAAEVGRSPVAFAERVVSESVLDLCRGPWNVLLRLASDEALIARSAAIFQRAFDAGTLQTTLLGPGEVEVALRGWPTAEEAARGRVAGGAPGPGERAAGARAGLRVRAAPAAPAPGVAEASVGPAAVGDPGLSGAAAARGDHEPRLHVAALATAGAGTPARAVAAAGRRVDDPVDDQVARGDDRDRAAASEAQPRALVDGERRDGEHARRRRAPGEEADPGDGPGPARAQATHRAGVGVELHLGASLDREVRRGARPDASGHVREGRPPAGHA